MSTIQTNAIIDASGGNTTTVNGVTPNTNTVIGRNLIINGAMQVAQRGTSFTGLQNSPAYTVDRFEYRRINSWSTAQFAVTQESDGPAGFANSIKLATTTAETDTTSIAALSTMLEGQDLQQLKYGTASAESMTFSFWVKSYQTGTYSFVIQATDLNNAIYGSLYTINSSNTWEKKTITIPAPLLASSTAIANGNTLGLEIIWHFAYRDSAGTLTNNSWDETTNNTQLRWYSVNGQTINGSTSTSNYLQITGVKLEVGSVATEFDHRSYGEELALCQRYYWNTNGFNNRYVTAIKHDSSWYCSFSAPITMRTDPTVTANGGSSNSYRVWDGQSSVSQNTTLGGSAGSCGAILITSNISHGSTGEGGLMTFGDGSNADRAYVELDAEL